MGTTVPATRPHRAWHRARASRLVAGLLAGTAALTACTNTPPPPLVTSQVTQAMPTRPTSPSQIIIGVDSVAGGYNPHVLADQSAVTTALASVVLPSIFRTGPDGTPQLDRTLVTSAEVTRSEPFTVRYTIRREASWSDGAPIAAEDFVYLWDQMRRQPGVVDPAGYRLISDIAARDAGKTVEVTFSKPYPGWRSLFTNLLPAHLLKDAPGGWEAALQNSFPGSGGPFSIRSLDLARSEITLERNDRYWDRPVLIDQILLRRSDLGGMHSALQSGNDQGALLRADAIAVNNLKMLGDVVRLTIVPRPTVVQLLLRPESPRLADTRVRDAVAALIDRDTLIALGTGNGPSARLRADAQVLAPSQRGYAPTIAGAGVPARPDPALAERLLTEAGYVRVAGIWMRDGLPLSLVVAAQAEREPYVTLAKHVRLQLTDSGITAKVVMPPGDQLFGDVLTAPTPANPGPDDGSVDIAVVPQPVGGDASTVLASNFGCRTALPEATQRTPSNPAGFCDVALQPTIDRVLTGAVPLNSALPALEATLWRQSVFVPLFQLSDVLVTRPEVTGVDAGPPLAGSFANAPVWKRLTPTPPR